MLLSFPPSDGLPPTIKLGTDDGLLDTDGAPVGSYVGSYVGDLLLLFVSFVFFVFFVSFEGAKEGVLLLFPPSDGLPPTIKLGTDDGLLDTDGAPVGSYVGSYVGDLLLLFVSFVFFVFFVSFEGAKEGVLLLFPPSDGLPPTIKDGALDTEGAPLGIDDG